MKKLIIAAVIFTSSLSALGNDFYAYHSVELSLKRVEVKTNAKCEYVRSTSFVRASAFRWHKRIYFCVSNSARFKTVLKVRETAQGLVIGPNGYPTLGDYGKPIVTNVNYYR